MQALVAQNKSVLLTSYTNRQALLCADVGLLSLPAGVAWHIILLTSTAFFPPSPCSAVDNILMKLAREEVPFVRLGREAGVHPAVRPWVPGGERYPRKTTRQLARLADSIPVVSCAGALLTWPSRQCGLPACTAHIAGLV